MATTIGPITVNASADDASQTAATSGDIAGATWTVYAPFDSLGYVQVQVEGTA